MSPLTCVTLISFDIFYSTCECICELCMRAVVYIRNSNNEFMYFICVSVCFWSIILHTYFTSSFTSIRPSVHPSRWCPFCYSFFSFKDIKMLITSMHNFRTKLMLGIDIHSTCMCESQMLFSRNCWTRTNKVTLIVNVRMRISCAARNANFHIHLIRDQLAFYSFRKRNRIFSLI